MVSASKLASERMQLDLLFKITLSSAPQEECVVRGYVPLHTSRKLKVVHDSGDVDVSRPETLNSYICTTRAVCTFLRHKCRAHFIVSRPPPDLNYQCREAKHDIPRLYQTRPTHPA